MMWSQCYFEKNESVFRKTIDATLYNANVLVPSLALQYQLNLSLNS